MIEIILSIFIIILPCFLLYNFSIYSERINVTNDFKDININNIDFQVMLLNLKFMNTKIIEFGGNSYTIYRYVGKNYKNVNIKTSVCCRCGDYIDSIKSMEEKIYCKCENVFYTKIKFVHREKLIKVLNELIYTMYSESESEFDVCDYSLKPSTYSHKGACNPDHRTCYSCWRYWCICCNGGLGGMYGKCNYKRCRIGRKNLGKEY